MAFVTLTPAISSVLSTGLRTLLGNLRSTPRSSARRMPRLPGGSYVMVQKYLHDLAGIGMQRPTEEQERIIGRTKLSDIELDDASKPSSAHNALTTIVKDGKEIKILRDNMPFGRAGGEFGTYFIGYSRSPVTIEQMLENMFIGKPPGNYDRLLDFSRAVTGSLFFVPSATFLDKVADDESPPAMVNGSSGVERFPSDPAPDGSLRIGSLKGKHEHE